MKWDRFTSRKRGRANKDKDDFDRAIEVIEKFAPKKYLSKREAFFYNYRSMGSYKKSLLLLLKTIAENDRFEADQVSLAGDLFKQLKDFYDLKDRLSPEEAIKDLGLIRKYRELFLYFYNKKDLSTEEVLVWIGKTD